MTVISHQQDEAEMTQAHTGARHEPSERRPGLRTSVVGNSRAHRLLLAAGLTGSVLFNATFLIDGALRPGYGTLRQPMSALSLGPGGWVQVANFIVFGVLTCCSAIGWSATLRPGGGSVWYPRLKVLAGLMLVTAGVFSQDPGLGFPPGVAASARATTHAQIHNLAAVVSLVATIAGMFILARRLRQEPRWRGWGHYAALSGGLMVVFLAAFGATMDHSNFGGMFEKLATITAMVFAIAFTSRLLTGDARLSPTTPGALTQALGPPQQVTQQKGNPTPTPASPWCWWLVTLVVAGALLTATGGILALHPAGEHLSSAGRNYAEYFFTRNLAMALALSVMLGLRARRALGALMVLTALIQILDTVTASGTGRLGLVPVDLVFAAAFLIGASHLSSKPLWRPSSWREPPSGGS
jgi:hypothetical protein